MLRVLISWNSIVAVHGLGGDPWSTWTHRETEECWIKDFLPSDIEEARILTYEYQTTVAVEELAQSILTISKQLLESLETWRSRDPVCPTVVRFATLAISNSPLQCRPLVFVAHSLGGIIVKDVRTLPLTKA